MEQKDTQAPTLERNESEISRFSPGYTQGRGHVIGRSVGVQSIIDDRSKTVIIYCDGGNVRFQHNMTPNEARELAGYLYAEANVCDQWGKVKA